MLLEAQARQQRRIPFHLMTGYRGSAVVKGTGPEYKTRARRSGLVLPNPTPVLMHATLFRGLLTPAPHSLVVTLSSPDSHDAILLALEGSDLPLAGLAKS